MKKKYLPFLIGVPNMGVGLLWAMNMVLIPMLVATVTESTILLGILTSMGAFTGIFVQYLAGILSDRSKFKMGKRKPFMLLGSICAAIFMCVMPFARSYPLMFLAAFLFYFSLNFYQGPYYSMIPETVDNKQLGLANGFSKVVSVLGSAIIFVAGPALWDKGSYLPFFLAAALALSSVAVTAIIVKEKPAAAIATPKLSFDFLKHPAVMKLYIGVFFVFLSYGCITPYFARYCTDVLNLTSGTASNGLLVLTLAGALFAAPIGILSDKIERRKVLLLGTLLFTASLLVAVFTHSVVGLYIVLAIIGIGFIAIQITIYSILAEIVPPARLGEFMGIMNLFISLSQFIANLALGFILERLGFGLFFPIATAMMFIAFLIVLFSKYPKYAGGKE